MDKTPKEYNDIFASLNEKLRSNRMELITSTATPEFRNQVKSIWKEFLSATSGQDGVTEYQKNNSFSPQAISGLWMSLSYLARHDYQNRQKWMDQMSTMMRGKSAGWNDLFVINREFPEGFSETFGEKPIERWPESRKLISESSTYQSFELSRTSEANNAEIVEVDLQELLSAIKSSPEVTNAIIGIVEAKRAEAKQRDLDAIFKPRRFYDDGMEP